MNEFKPEDVVLVYKDTPTFKDGTVAQVIDRDPNDNSYAVADLRDIGKADRDIGVILNRYAKWVKPENMQKLSFDKPKESHTGRVVFSILFVTFLIGLGVYLEQIL